MPIYLPQVDPFPFAQYEDLKNNPTVNVSTEYKKLEPIGFIFVIFFALVLSIQIIGMLIHRSGHHTTYWPQAKPALSNRHSFFVKWHWSCKRRFNKETINRCLHFGWQFQAKRHIASTGDTSRFFCYVLSGVQAFGFRKHQIMVSANVYFQCER